MGKRVLVSAGGTREPLDAVRFVGNRSSGRMGVALAEEARRRGADVTLLAANLSVSAPAGMAVVETPTAADFEREALARADADVIVMAAAVSDYRPAAPSRPSGRRARSRGRSSSSRRRDVLATLGAGRSNEQILVGFAADGAESGLERARDKRRAKNADIVVFNDVSRDDIGFDSADNEVVLLSDGGERAIEKAPKPVVAAAVFDEVERLLSEDDRRSARRRAGRVAHCGRRGCARRREPPAGGPGSALDARALRALHPRGGPSHHRGLPGRREDAAREVDRALARPHVLALQFTPDLLPTDVTGVNVYDQRAAEFEFRPGPVFANVLLVDEINRASPKTQSALLEAMQEAR